MTYAPLSYNITENYYEEIEIEAAFGHQYLLQCACRAGGAKGAGAEVRRVCRGRRGWADGIISVRLSQEIAGSYP